MSIKELIVQNYLENMPEPAELQLACDEWNRVLTCDRIPNLGARREIETAACALAGSYQTAGLREGFSLACQVFGELFAEMLKGGAQA